ncbi:linamarin synthase 1-like [Cryptomeria japonica]|uniref:linamarin synthase 1-like n=1 Tax=Cryptomeria japonica TaxID=3369 RepID=UPI0025AB98BD|nr:linamarin synthase 1-like [Cryptomeria japonica]
MITSLPGNIPALWPSDLISFYREQFSSTKRCYMNHECVTRGTMCLSTPLKNWKGREAAAALSIKGCPSMSIGPVFLPNFLGGENSTLSNMSMWEEDDSCLHWLDELALGLEQSGHAFLWVLRSDIAQRQAVVLPEGLEERTKDRALFVKWTPQLKVLGHPSIRQRCMDFKDVDIDDGRLMRREEIKSAVVSVMESEELQKKAAELKEAATKAVMAGGSSFNNITSFINDMFKHAKSQSQRSY